MATLEMSASDQTFEWRRWPEAESLVAELVQEAVAGHDFLAELHRRMETEASVRLVDFVDHLTVFDVGNLVESLRTCGFVREMTTSSGMDPVYHHPEAMFPRLIVREPVLAETRRVAELAVQVEAIADFSRAHDLGLKIDGWPLGPYRIARIPEDPVSLAIVERRGYRGFDVFPGELARIGQMSPTRTRDAWAGRELWAGRRRRFEEDTQGFDVTDAIQEEMIDRVGDRDLACHLAFEVEREYWQSRNRAARIQKARQDRLGLGWANHDHHTFRSSREQFPRLIRILQRFGFNLRERFHAGEEAGWGAQVLEHPPTGIVIFADLDLAPDEATSNFSQTALPALDRPNTVGLWIGLHGESILEAGMHHLEAQFDFDRLRVDLRDDAKIEMMKPFSDFPFLRQAFTQGEQWIVDSRRVQRCQERGWITAEQAEEFLAHGARGSHLENLQRAEGYKGFNQRAVSAIMEETDPRRR